MKNMMRRALGVVLTLGLTVSLLSGCGGPDPVKDVMGYSSSTVMFTVNGKDVTAGQYFFWLADQADQASSYLNLMAGEETDGIPWDMEIEEGVTAADSVKEAAKQYAIMYSVVESKGQEKGYSYTEEDKKAYQEDLATIVEQMGGEESFQTWLKGKCVTEKGFERISSVSAINEHMARGLFREGSEDAPTAEELQQYAEQQDLLAAKHILLLTKDMTTGKAYDAEKAAAQKAKAEELLAQLQAVTDPAELAKKFDELMQANSEDSGLAANPDGYVFTAGEMVEAFEQGTRALEFGQMSGLVESDYGYHIILRQDPAQVEAVRQQWEGQKMMELSTQWVDEAEVETTETFDNLSVADFYEKLTAYRDTLMKESEEEAGTTDGQTNNGEGQTDAEEGKTDAAEGEANTEEGKTDAAEGEANTEEGKTDAAEGEASTEEGKTDAAEDGKTDAADTNQQTQ